MYNALTRASVIIEVLEDVEKYEAVVVSTNGSILQPYDKNTTLVGTVLKNNTDITNRITNVRWTKWNPTADDIIECPEWNKKHVGQSSIMIDKDDVDGKSIFTFEAYDNSNNLLCSASISIVDINDVLVATEKPTTPYVGQVWVDATTDPATLYVWNGFKWMVTGAVGALAINLLRNTGFLLNSKYWDIVGDPVNSYIPTAYDYLDHRFLRLNSVVKIDERRGLAQTTIDEVKPNNSYSFQMLFYSKEKSETYSNEITVGIYSIDSAGIKTPIDSIVLYAEDRIQKLFRRFTTLGNTKKLKVEITGKNNFRYDFSIAEPALYNTWNDYPWDTNPKDLRLDDLELDQEKIWDLFSAQGMIQGLFAERNPNTGQLEYYLNANHITAGLVKAKYMEMYGLKVFKYDEDRGKPSKKEKDITLEVTENGHIIIRADKFVIDTPTFKVSEDGLLTAIDAHFEGTIESTEMKASTIEGSELISSKVTASEIISKDYIDDGFGEMLPVFHVTSEGKVTAMDAVIRGQLSGGIIEGETLKTASGKFIVTEDGRLQCQEAEIHGTIKADSVIADSKIQGSLIIGSRIQNREKDPTFSVTADGIVTGASLRGGDIGIGNGDKYDAFTVDQNGNCNITKGSITIGKDFMVTESGELFATKGNFTGDITGSKIKGTDIVASTLSSSDGKFSIDESGNINGGSLTIGSKFSVTKAGVLTAKDANFTGNINAGSVITGATIRNADGSFRVSPQGVVTGASIRGGTIGIGADNYTAFQVNNNGDVKITRGSITIGDNFSVENNGDLVANNANISGKITSSSGTIGGFTISESTLTSTNIGMSSDVNNYAFWAGSDIPSSAPFRVRHDGKLTATNIVISGGSIDGSTLQDGTVDGGALVAGSVYANKLAIGDFTNYCGLNENTADELGFDIVKRNGQNWFKLRTLIRDAKLNVGEGYRTFTCRGGDTFRITGEISSNVQCYLNDYSTGAYGYCNVNIGVYALLEDGSYNWQGIPYCITGSSSAPNTTFSVTTTLHPKARSFSVYLQLAGWDGWNGRVYIRNIDVRRMAGGDLIVDGSISANKIQANAITADKIHANALTGKTINNGNGTFYVDSNGNMQAYSATISGNITATSGKIAGYTISGDILRGTNVGMCGRSGQEWAFWAGAWNGSNSAFRVGHEGNVYARNFYIGNEAITSGAVYHTNSYSRWTHSDGSYTQISAAGLEHRDGNGTAPYHYLFDVKVVDFTGNAGGSYITVWLPERFRGKNFTVAWQAGNHIVRSGKLLGGVTVAMRNKNIWDATIELSMTVWTKTKADGGVTATANSDAYAKVFILY